MRQAGLAAADIHASGRLEGGRTSLLAQVALPRGGSLRVEGSAPLDPAGAVDVVLRGALDAGLANVALAASGRRVAGRLTVDLRAQGQANRPQLSGTASLAGGSYEDPLAGVKFDRIETLLRGRGEELTIERFTAATRGNGSVSVAGTVRLAPEAGFPASLRITGQRAELVSNDIVTAVADLALQLDGPMASKPRVSGRIAFQSFDIRVPDQIPVSNRPLEDAIQIDPTPAARARMAVAAQKRRARRAAGPPFNADLAIALSAPSHIFVRGRGIDAELGGELTLGGDLARPVANGAFQMRRGAFSIAGKNLNFSRGNIRFDGDVIPNLDFVAQSASSDVTAQIAITGPADQPVFTFSSTPQLPQDEVISRLLFSSSTGSLTAMQSLQLAQTVAELSGQGGPGVLDKMRRMLGVDSLNVLLGPDGAPRAGASRYIMRNVNVGVRTGAKPADNGVTLGVDVTNRLRVQGEAGADGSATVGVGAQWEY
jgi:translocation and assembly module TamB